MSFHWTCPYCDRDTTITDTVESFKRVFDLKSADGYRSVAVSMVVCPNPNCQKFTLKALMYEIERLSYMSGEVSWRGEELLQTWNLIPPSIAKAFPDYCAAAHS